MANLSLEEAQEFGMAAIKDELMPNQEFRFRRMHQDGSGYIRTQAGDEGAWQNSHFHLGVKEIYAVQSGWMAIVELRDGQPVWRILREGDTVTTEIGVAHNVYLPVGAAIHTVKFGRTQGPDWHACPELDALTKGVGESDILARCCT